MNSREKKRIDNYISGRMEIETDGPDIIIKVRPVEGDPPPTGEYIPDRSIRIQFSDEQKAYLAKRARNKGPVLTALWRGIKKGFRIGGNVLILGVAGAGLAAAGGAVAPLALAGAAVAAAAGGIGPVLAAEKAVKAAPGKDYKGPAALFVLLGKLFLEVMKYLKSRKGAK